MLISSGDDGCSCATTYCACFCWQGIPSLYLTPPHQLMGSGGVEYLWSPRLTQPGYSPEPACNPSITISYSYWKVTDIAGCMGYDSVFVQVFEGPNYHVPECIHSKWRRTEWCIPLQFLRHGFNRVPGYSTAMASWYLKPTNGWKVGMEDTRANCKLQALMYGSSRGR